jgi:hypothetical protein
VREEYYKIFNAYAKLGMERERDNVKNEKKIRRKKLIDQQMGGKCP